MAGIRRERAPAAHRRSHRHIRRAERACALRRPGCGFAGVGAAAGSVAQGQRRREGRPRPRGLLRRRAHLRRAPVLLQDDGHVGEGGGGSDAEPRDGAPRAGARVPRAVDEGQVRGRRCAAAERGQRHGRAEAGADVRRAEAVPSLHAAGGEGVRGRAAVGGLAVRAEARPCAGAGSSPVFRGERTAQEEVAQGQNAPGDVPAAERGHGLPAAHLHGRLRGRRNAGRRRRRQRRRPRRDSSQEEHRRLHERGDVREAPSPHPPLRDVQQEAGGQGLHPLQEDASALSAARLPLRPLRWRLQGPLLHEAEVEDAERRRRDGQGGRRHMEAAGEEGGGCEGHVVLGRQEEAGASADRAQVLAKTQRHKTALVSLIRPNVIKHVFLL